MKMIYFFTYLTFSFKIDLYLIVFNTHIYDLFLQIYLVFHISNTTISSILKNIMSNASC